MRTRPFLLAALLILTALAPFASAGTSIVLIDEKEPAEQVSEFDFPIRYIDDVQPRISTSGTNGRAACPTVQTDGGSAGDAGNTSATAKSFGTNPNNGNSGGVTGCIDSNDPEDMYSVTTTAGKDVDVELVVPSGADFDLYLVDSTKQVFYDFSEYNDPLEKVTTAGTNLSGQATTFYIWVNLWSSDGQYTLRVWTNNTIPRPDMTITAVSHPSKAQAGDTINVNYTVENLANNSSANTGAFDVFFILSTDTTYDGLDTLLDEVSKEADLAANSSRDTSMSITLPANLTNDSYYWIVWADGYGNITESNSSNNDMTSANQMVVGDDCTDLLGGQQDDAGLGSDAGNDVANATNMGNNVTATYTGCMDGGDGDDMFAFDVPSGHYIEISLDAEDQSSDFDLYIHDSNATEADNGLSASYPETASTKLTNWEGVGGTYIVNITHWSGVSNYTLDVWTNVSIPAPDFTVDSVTGPGSGMPGDTVVITAVVNNSGTLDANSSFLVRAYLTSYLGIDWYDYNIGETSVSSLAVDTTQNVLIQTTLPTEIIEGDYYLTVVVDEDDLVIERDENNNELRKNGEFSVGNEETSCGQQNDANTGGDAGNAMGSQTDLGQYAQAEHRGCIDSNDVNDYYKINLASGENLNVTLIDPPAGAVGIDLLFSDGTQIDSSFQWGFSANYVSTWDSDYNGTAGTYTLIVNRSTQAFVDGGVGTYRLLVGEPQPWVAPFTCGGHSDLGGSSGDAGTDLSMSMELGANPSESGQGCLDGQDLSDAYHFSLSEMKNVEINFTEDAETPVTTILYDGDGIMISEWDGMMWSTLNTTYEGTDGEFTLVIMSVQSTGFYNLSITTTDAAPADFEITGVMCPSDAISADEVAYSFTVINNRGPTSLTFSWSFELLDPNGSPMPEIDSNSLSTYSTYGQIIINKSANFFLEETLPSGNYSCRVTIDVDNTVAESNEDNNMMQGDSFYVQNEAELWANDVDRDGYNTTDMGDGIVDDCPETWGESLGDRYGCADLDGDGWSNLNDFEPLNEKQWLDTDGDGFGDNSSAYGGDQCPEVAGIEGGDGGDGCPPPFVDDDFDGIQNTDDDCDNTPVDAVVDEDGCADSQKDSDGDGIVDSLDDCLETTVGVNVGSDGCEITTGGNNGGNDGDGGSDGDGDGDGGSDGDGDGTVNDETKGSSMDLVTIGSIGFGVVIILLLSLLIVRKGRKSGLADEAFANAAFAADPMAGMAASDPSITPEQLTYEQQLVAAGYPPEYARQYADQHFRPWLNP